MIFRALGTNPLLYPAGFTPISAVTYHRLQNLLSN